MSRDGEREHFSDPRVCSAKRSLSSAADRGLVRGPPSVDGSDGAKRNTFENTPRGYEMKRDVFGVRGTVATAQGPVQIHRLRALEAGVAPGVDRLPFSIKVPLESVVRNLDGELVTEED